MNHDRDATPARHSPSCRCHRRSRGTHPVEFGRPWGHRSNPDTTRDQHGADLTATRPGVKVVQTGYDDPGGLRRACTEVDSVVSAINGLDSAIIGAQSRLLEAAAEAGVPRFIPSVFSIDYRGIRPRTNRNLQLPPEGRTTAAADRRL
ncbi:hypothetical protein E5206_13935 [Arthrobacter sp. PAMC25564]|nr:hypothetical protein E5206_13935 [Arthrobacter sp. PAMC25564]